MVVRKIDKRMNDNNHNQPTLSDPFSSENDWLQDMGELPQPVVQRTNWKDSSIGKLSMLCGGSVVFGLLGGAFAAQLLAAGDMIAAWMTQMVFQPCCCHAANYLYLKGWWEMGASSLILIAVFLSYAHGFLGRIFLPGRASGLAWIAVVSMFAAFSFQSGIWQTTAPIINNVLVVSAVVVLNALAFCMGDRVSASLSVTTDPLKLYQASVVGLLPAVVLLSPAASISLFLTLATCLSVPLLTGYMVSSKLSPSTKRSAALFSITSITPLMASKLALIGMLAVSTLSSSGETGLGLMGNVFTSSFTWAIILIAMVASPAAVVGGLLGFAATPARRAIGIANPEEDDFAASRVAKLRG